VRDLAEVFTAEEQVRAMLDLPGIAEACRRPEARFLEPACGNGNFLVEILERKIAVVAEMPTRRGKGDDPQPLFEFQVLVSVASVYGIDISEENVSEARIRMHAAVSGFYASARNTWSPSPGFFAAIDAVLATNIVLGDSLNGADGILFVEYSVPKPLHFTRRWFRLSDLGNSRVKPVRHEKAVHYLNLADAPELSGEMPALTTAATHGGGL
jgi:SAM-dependent methyltransferase